MRKPNAGACREACQNQNPSCWSWKWKKESTTGYIGVGNPTEGISRDQCFRQCHQSG